MSRLLEKANWITLMLCVGVIQVSTGYLLSATWRPDGLLAVAQPDSALYFQAARRIVEGGPFTYCVGGALQTGTSSVLYPFLLAVPYALGFSGGLLTLAGFLLNAASYLLFLFCWAQVIDIKVREPAAKVLSALLLALFGQFAVVSLAQSDSGLWMAVSSFFALGLAKNRTRWWGGMLVLAPWVRPEGMVCVFAVTLVAFTIRRYRRVALFGLLSVFGVFLLNRFLAGDWQFSSVQGKGYFVTEPFFTAVMSSTRDGLIILRQLFLGLASGSVRDFYFFPVLGAGCFWYHVLRRDYSDFDAREAIFLLAAAGGIATVAVSGWQGTNMDRYLAWLLPVMVIWTACGAVEFGSRLKGAARFIPASLIVLFGLVGSVAEACWFRLACERTESAREFYSRCETAMSAGAALGGYGNAAFAYWLSPRRFVHLYGIYTPDCKTRSLLSALEILKHHPQQRFDYWLFDEAIEGDLLDKDAVAACGPTVLNGPSGLSLRRPDWGPFDAALAEPAPPAAGLRCRARVDVGYEADELAAGYQVYGAFAQRAPEVFFRLDTGNGGRLAEVGRVVTGADEMSVHGLIPGQSVQVVMRTALSQRVDRVGPTGIVSETYTFEPSQTLQVMIDGEAVGPVTYSVGEKGFTDVAFTVPRAAIRSDSAKITLTGEHITFGYWFYQ